MARQYQIPGGPYVNVAEDGREYALPGYGVYLNTKAAAAATVVGPLIEPGHLGGGGPLLGGRLVPS